MSAIDAELNILLYRSSAEFNLTVSFGRHVLHPDRRHMSAPSAVAMCVFPPLLLPPSPLATDRGLDVFIDVAPEESSSVGDDKYGCRKRKVLCAHVDGLKLWARAMGALGTGAVVLLVVGFEMRDTAMWVTGLVLLTAAVVLGNLSLVGGSLHVSGQHAQDLRKTRPEDIV